MNKEVLQLRKINFFNLPSFVLRVAFILILYFFVWFAYFNAFVDARLMRGYGSDSWFEIWSHKYFGVWLGALIHYGLFAPLICAFIFGAITSREKVLKTTFWLFILIAAFVVISTGFEFLFEHGSVAWWKFYICNFPPICFVGAVIGRLFKIFFLKKQL